MLREAVFAYIGPGPGLGLTWALVGLLITLASAAGAVLVWPLRALIGRIRHGSRSQEAAEHEPADPPAGAAGSASES